MAVPDLRRKTKRGFALIAVLSGLVILTSLFAITSSRFLTRLQAMRSNSILAENKQMNIELLKLVLNNESQFSEHGSSLQTRLNGASVSLQLVDTGGLIDLNTAAPELLERLAVWMELPEDALPKYRAWRRTPYRLLRVNDFLRVTGAGPEHYGRLSRVATVFSGRSGIAPQQAPAQVLELVTGRRGKPEALATAVPARFLSPETGTNFNVLANFGSEGSPVLIGTIQFERSFGNGRVLWVP